VGGPIALGAFVLGNILSTLGLPKRNFAFARQSPSRVESSTNWIVTATGRQTLLGNDKGTDIWWAETHAYFINFHGMIA
jgi:hypothetical protein